MNGNDYNVKNVLRAITSILARVRPHPCVPSPSVADPQESTIGTKGRFKHPYGIKNVCNLSPFVLEVFADIVV